MKFSNRLCVCVVWMSSCFAVVTLAESTSSTVSSIASTNTAMSSTQPSTSSTTSQAPVSLQSNSTGNESDSNSTNTSSTTQPSTSLSTTMQPTLCKNGTCLGNDSSCLNETIKQTCTLTGSDNCFQVVFINETDTYYEVGCMASCENLHEDAAGDVTKTTRCCKTNLCNNELLSDPDPESSAIQTSMSCITVILLLIANRVFT